MQNLPPNPSDASTLQPTSAPKPNRPRGPKPRPKAEPQRIRVSRACDSCKRKKVRCSGKQPCAFCLRGGITCQFTAPYNRGRIPSIEVAEDATIGEWSPVDSNNAPSRSLTVREEDESDSSSCSSSRASPEPFQTDSQGHYVGSSSGISFLLRIQKKLRQNVSFSANSSIFTFGDAPLAELDSTFFVLPPKAETEELVSRYFDFVAPTHRFLHRPTIETWLEDLYNNLGTVRNDGDFARTAVLFMVLAQAQIHLTMCTSLDTEKSTRYFLAAENRLSAERGAIKLASIQARVCQCFYLLSQSRMNHCWTLFGTTARLALAIGLHRKRGSDPSGSTDLIDAECRKRVFWVLYSLDNYLSITLGRPRTFHDDDIDQVLPSVVDDKFISSRMIVTDPTRSRSIMQGVVAHAKLSRIVSLILHDLYSIRPPKRNARGRTTRKHVFALQNWRKPLARLLDADADGFDTSLLIPIFGRQRNVLNLAYCHALILVYRPYLLQDFANLHDSDKDKYVNEESEEMVAECLKAALKIISIVNELVDQNQLYRSYWFTHYFAFCAIAIIYIHIIQQRNPSPSQYADYYVPAERCQKQISSIAVRDSLSYRYAVVLEELRLESIKRMQEDINLQNVFNGQENSSGFHLSEQRVVAPSDELASGTQAGVDLDTPADFNPNGDGLFLDIDPSNMGWSEFDSLVTAGMSSWTGG